MSKILVFGGTHGNEWTGVYLVKKYAETLKKKFSALDLEFIHANPKAHNLNKRFCDEDLNRVFGPINQNLKHQTYEYQRGLEILQEIQEKKPDWIFDLHTTTANLGSTLIITQEDPKNLKLAQAVTQKLPHVKIIFAPDPTQKYLLSQVKHGLMLEVGPVAGSIVDPLILAETKLILETIFKILKDEEYLTIDHIEYFEEVKDIFYPEDNGSIAAMIHPELQSKDFLPLKTGAPLLLHFNNEVTYYEETEELFPIFINEAAYYPTKLALTLCRKTKRTI
jgi:aspartoacylase